MSAPLHPYQTPPFSTFTDRVTAWYEGLCPMTKVWCRLPRTLASEHLATALMQQLRDEVCYQLEGKMYGVLIVENAAGEQFYLKAFSGLLQGKKDVPGWVPFIDGGDRLLLEEQEILAQLREIRRRIIALENLPERAIYQTLSARWLQQINQFNEHRRHQKKEREQQRLQLSQNLQGGALETALKALTEASRQESNRKRDLKQARDQELGSLQTLIAASDAELAILRKRRKTLSRNLQKQMHQLYSLKNFAGESQAIAQLLPQGMPTGTGDCCAPKLLNYAATHHLTPLALAEFWWGKNTVDKTVGEFYLACAERCQPILGFLLAGLEQKSFETLQNFPEIPLEILYEDDSLLGINKPPGLPSIPGRSSHHYDSAFSRLKRDLPAVYLVHRLDQDTSGVLLFAKTTEVQQALQRQFRRREIHKMYEALLEKPVAQNVGIIDLPIWSDPGDRPRQKVDWQRGKTSQTHYRTLGANRIELQPITGRTHQLRVHCADPGGLANPILGDRLYGQEPSTRLFLHAKSLTLQHPITHQQIMIRKNTDF
jgi:tRNA pseudouridine32 synthase/23S rRNA pseudouridine746 synthase